MRSTTGDFRFSDSRIAISRTSEPTSENSVQEKFAELLFSAGG
jgi:hypothetical protein